MRQRVGGDPEIELGTPKNGGAWPGQKVRLMTKLAENEAEHEEGDDREEKHVDKCER